MLHSYKFYRIFDSAFGARNFKLGENVTKTQIVRFRLRTARRKNVWVVLPMRVPLKGQKTEVVCR